MKKNGTNPMHRLEAARSAPRCTATSKRTGSPCQAPAVRGWAVCRMHGARGGGPSGKENGAYIHGQRTKTAIARRAALRELINSVQSVIRALCDV